MTETGPVRRGLVLAVVAGALVAATLLGEAIRRPRLEAAWATRPQRAEAGPRAPGPDTLSTAWYCPAGRSDGEGPSEVVAIANAGEVPVRASVTVLADGEVAGRTEIEVAPRSRQPVEVAEVAEAADPGVVVEVFGGSAAVEHLLTGNGDIATAPCSRRPATRWWFAGGTTAADARDQLAILNPFVEDAIVDMAFFTGDGQQRPQALQGFVVPARSRVTVDVHAHVLRQEVVGAEVTARPGGRVVVERLHGFTGDGGRQGLGATLGVTRPAPLWAFPEGLVGEGVREELWVLNPGQIDTEVEISAEPADGAPIEPQVVPVPARSSVAVAVGEFLESGAHALLVEAIGASDVVVQQAVATVPDAPRVGFSVAPGIADPAERWLFPVGSADDVFDEWISVRNPGSRPATFRISVLAGGVALVPEGYGALEVEPGARRTVRMGDALKRSDLPVLVEADRPLQVVRGLYRADGVSVEPGIPFEGDR